MNINTVAISGNLTRDPELRATSGGTSVCDLGVAVNERAKVNGEWTDRANFFNVTVFGNSADACAQYLIKGSAVNVQGRLRYERWEKDGQKRNAVKIVADVVQFIGPKAERGAAPVAWPASAPASAPAGDDDIPFLTD